MGIKKLGTRASGPELGIVRDASTEDFPFCCGVSVIGDFQDTTNAGTEEWDEDAGDYKVAPSGTTRAQAVVNCTGGVTLATTAPEQKDAVAALQACGFEAITEFRNPRSGKTLTLWGRVNSKPKARRR